jgi:hypothetical protein
MSSEYSTNYFDYMFNNAGRIGADRTDNTQRTLQNTRFANHMLSSYFNESISSENIDFVSKQPTMTISGLARGDGLNGKVVDYDSLLLIKTTQERPQEKLQLMQRPFLTVPYLGRGSCNPDTESQLLQGESTWDKKGVSTIMDKSFLPYSMYILDDNMEKHVKNQEVEESALEGWVRGGIHSRELSGK